MFGWFILNAIYNFLLVVLLVVFGVALSPGATTIGYELTLILAIEILADYLYFKLD